MDYPYEDIYGCIALAGLEEAPKIHTGDGLSYAELFTKEGRMEHYQTDADVFLLFSPNHDKFTPFWPHSCYDHVLYILHSWQLNGRLITAEGKQERNLQKELFGRTMIACVEYIMHSETLAAFQLEAVWQLTVETKNMLERFLSTAEAIDGTTIRLSTKRI